MRKAIIIGSGISGLSIARMLSNRFEIEILEREKQIGGLIKCERINDNLFHKVGGHVFNSKNQTVLDWFWGHFNRDKEFLKAHRNAKILINNQLVGYPIENFLYQLPEAQLKPIIKELLQKLKYSSREFVDYGSFKEFLIGNFGQELYKLYFGPYNSKIWNTNLEKVPLAWLDGKLPMPNLDDIFLSNILRKGENSMVHSSFFYAKRGGSQFFINRLAKGLKINRSFTVSSIERISGSRLSINKGERIADSVVFTGDVRQLHKIVKFEDYELRRAMLKVENLQSNGTSNVFCETDPSALSWLYLPETQFRAHRIIYTGNFSLTNNEGSKRQTCVVEFSGRQERSDMLEEIKKLPGNLKALSFNYEPNSYIIQDSNTRENIFKLKAKLKPYKVYLLGRFAEWEYYNMDKCIESALDLSEKI